MDRDDDTLPERLTALVRASFAKDDLSRRLVLDCLEAPDPRARVLALRAAARRGLLATPAWLAALGDHDAGVRREALVAIADGGGDATVLAALVDMLDDDDALVVEHAVFALGERQYTPALARLMRVARDHEDARCREVAVATLGVLGDDRALGVVIGALDDKPAVRRRAVVALANFDGPEVAAALDRARDDHDWQTRAAVAQLEPD